MPRIYYNDGEYHAHQFFLAVHLLLFTGGMLGMQMLVQTSDMLTSGWSFGAALLWAICLTYHAYATAPIHEGFQKRTYDRLRNRYGIDWDLTAPPHAFEYEQRKAVIEYKQRHALRDSARSLIGVGVTWGLLILLQERFVPVDLLLGYGLGWVLCNTLILLLLRRQLNDTMQKPKFTQQRAHLPASMPLAATPELTPSPGMTYTVGDDGELVEVPDETAAE